MSSLTGWSPRPDELSKIPRIGLDSSVDAPLPQWALNVLNFKGISKNTKIHLLKIQNLLITKGLVKK